MAENKTQRNDGDVLAYLESVSNKRRREDSLVVKELMEEVTGEPAEMWGTSIVGFRQLSLSLRQRAGRRFYADRLRAAQRGADALYHGRARALR